MTYNYLSEELIAKHTPSVLEKFYRTELREGEQIIDNRDKTIAKELGLEYYIVDLIIKYHLYEKYSEYHQLEEKYRSCKLYQ